MRDFLGAKVSFFLPPSLSSLHGFTKGDIAFTVKRRVGTGAAGNGIGIVVGKPTFHSVGYLSSLVRSVLTCQQIVPFVGISLVVVEFLASVGIARIPVPVVSQRMIVGSECA